jgi:hypothetical protein
MKFIFFFLLLFISTNYLSQINRQYFLNEYSFCVNHSIYNQKINTFGYGFGGYFIHDDTRNHCIISGLEFNYSKQVQAYEFTGGHDTGMNNNHDFLLSIKSISIPILFRIKFGTKKKLITDTGIFFEKIHSSKKILDLSPSENSALYTFSSGMNIYPFNMGVVLGFGVLYSFKTYDLILKPELKFGYFNNRYIKICLAFQLK